MTFWFAGDKVTAERLENFTQRGVEIVSFASNTSNTRTVTFPVEFDAAPIVMVNIASGSGTIARWMARAIGVTSADFTLFVFRGDAADPAVAWVDIPVQWMAVAP